MNTFATALLAFCCALSAPGLAQAQEKISHGRFKDLSLYRPKGEVEALRRNDPIPRLGEQLRRSGLIDDAQDQAIRARVSARITEAYEYGRTSPYPQPEDALLHVFN